VEGVPFSGVETGYSWAYSDAIVSNAILTIDSTAHRLAELALGENDHETAVFAACKGILANPGCEACYRNLMRAAAATSGQAGVTAVYNELRAVIDGYRDDDPSDELDSETVELYDQFRRLRGLD
jgi:Bacterial transcriptional activator domain